MLGCLSCKKSDFLEENVNDECITGLKSGNPDSNKIIEWLESLQSPSTLYTNEILEAIISNAEFDKMYSEDYEGEKLKIVPLRPVKFSQHVKEDSIPFQYFVLLEDTLGRIKKGNIALFYSDNLNFNSQPEISFARFLKTSTVVEDGRIAWLTLGDVKLYEYIFEDQMIIRSEVVQAERNSTLKCIQYSLVTTLYFSDGSTIEYSQYLFTSCDSEVGGSAECSPFSTFCDEGAYWGNGGNGYEDTCTMVTGNKYAKYRDVVEAGYYIELFCHVTAKGCTYQNSSLNVFEEFIEAIQGLVFRRTRSDLRMENYGYLHNFLNDMKTLRVFNYVTLKAPADDFVLGTYSGQALFHASNFFN